MKKKSPAKRMGKTKTSTKKSAKKSVIKKPKTKKSSAKKTTRKKKTLNTDHLLTHVPTHELKAPPRPVSAPETAGGLKQIYSAIDQFSLWLGHGISWLSFGMVVVMATTVALRYFFNITHTWQSELVLYLHASVFMGAVSYTLLREGHVRVDVLYQNFSNKTKAWVDLSGSVMFLFPVALALLFFSREFISQSWHLVERSAEYDGLPGMFLVKSLIWVFALLLMLQGISTSLRSIETIKRGH